MDKSKDLNADIVKVLSTWIGDCDSKQCISPEQQVLSILEDFEVLATAEKVIKGITVSEYKVALQFPDELLRYAPLVCEALRVYSAEAIAGATEIQTQRVFYFILGDTSYGECCVDEVAAEHLDANLVVHYGNACLSPTRTLPVIYVFPIFRFESPELASHVFRTSLETLIAQDSIDQIVVMFDIELQSCFRKDGVHFNDIFVGFDLVNMRKKVQFASIRRNAIHNVVNPRMVTVQEDDKLVQVGPLEFRDTSIPISRTAFLWFSRKDCIDDWPPAARNAALQLCTGPQDHCAGFFGTSLTAVTDTMPNLVDSSRLLRKRFSLLQKAQDADRIGIVPGTLGVSGSMEVIDRCKRVISSAGKRCYVMLVGKPNPAKLANFAEIDVFVLVACPQNALLDGRDYMQPIITPLELEAALVSDGDIFSSPYSTDFRNLLNKELDVEDIPDDVNNANASTVAVRGDWTVSVTGEGSAADYLKSRHWQGLSYSSGGINDETPIADLPVKAVVGQTGIASKYDNEGASKTAH